MNKAIALLLLASFSLISYGSDQSPIASQLTPAALLTKIDELYRSDSAMATLQMHITTPNWQRTLELQSWSRGLDDTFIRVLSPKKDRGVATLKIANDMWNFFPKINKVIKVPPSMMMGSWMGSDFTNDDLVREVSLVEQYSVTLTENESLYVLQLLPKQSTVTVWGKVEVEILKENLLPTQQRYYNEQGQLMRTMVFDEIKDFSGRLLPARMTMIPHNKTGHKTVVEYTQLKFDVPFQQDIFSLSHLQSRFQ